METTTRLAQFAEDFTAPGGKRLMTVNPAVYTGSTVLFRSYKDLQNALSGSYPGINYGTDRLPPQRDFEAALCELEGGAACRAFQSGINAIINTLMTFTKGGDHILICDNVYGPTARFCQKVLTGYGVEVELLPPDIGEDISTHLRETTRLIFLESPGSNTFEIQDLRAVAEAIQGRDIVTVLDNTWATPLFLKPLELGFDVSIQSVTKYIGGHSDLLLGAVTVNERVKEQFLAFYHLMENFASPAGCAVALKGLRTLPLRLARHQESALAIARWLDQHPLVDTVLHPGLPSHPQHHLWMRDFSGSSGLFAFTLTQEPNDQCLAAFIDNLELFGLGFSWGGFRSLLTASRIKRNFPGPLNNRLLIRLSIGLEAKQDLINDLEQGLAHLL
ncbi:MAG: cystathionine beta-lyase [Desulfobulbus propionicus]|nr:MAG: cystathionine beta-lyase [Desulfobulbus propionicus]